MSSDNAASTVFSVWELCESILEFLPCEDLARARRVASTLKKVVDGSGALQKLLFLQPRTEVLRWTVASGDGEHDEARREAQRWIITSGDGDHDKADKLLAGPNMARHVKEAILGGETASEFTILELHPALMVHHLHRGRTMSPHLRGCARNSSWRSYYDATEVLFDSITDPVAGIPFHSSLDKMFLSQPPVTKVRLTLRGRPGDDPRWLSPGQSFFPSEELVVQNDTGITFGQLRDEIQLAYHDYPRAYVDHLQFGTGFPVTRKQKLIIEATGVQFWDRDPFYAGGKLKAVVDRLGLVV